MAAIELRNIVKTSAYNRVNARIGADKGTLSVELFAKNLFNDSTYQTLSWNTYTPAVPRWVGVQFSGKL